MTIHTLSMRICWRYVS